METGPDAEGNRRVRRGRAGVPPGFNGAWLRDREEKKSREKERVQGKEAGALSRANKRD